MLSTSLFAEGIRARTSKDSRDSAKRMVKGWVNIILNHDESPNSLRRGSSLNAPKLGLRGFS